MGKNCPDPQRAIGVLQRRRVPLRKGERQRIGGAVYTHEAYEKGITLKEAALSMGLIDEATFDAVVDPQKMLGPEGV